MPATKKTVSKKPELRQELLLLGFLCVKDCEKLVDKLAILDRFGFTGPELEIICGATMGSIRNTRMELKGNKKKNMTEEPKEQSE